MATREQIKLLNKEVYASDIEFRVQSISQSNMATVLAYKDARYDQKILDEIVGPSDWYKEYKIINNSLYCGISIWVDEIEQWVTKWDVGEAQESGISPEKSLASDAQKRAGFAWGIGRKLYDFPRITVRMEADEYTEVQRGSRTVKNPAWGKNPSDWTWNVMYYPDDVIRVIGIDKNNRKRFDSHPTLQAAPIKSSTSVQKNMPDAVVENKRPLDSFLPSCKTPEHFNNLVHMMKKDNDMTNEQRIAFFKSEILPAALSLGIKYDESTKSFAGA